MIVLYLAILLFLSLIEHFHLVNLFSSFFTNFDFCFNLISGFALHFIFPILLHPFLKYFNTFFHLFQRSQLIEKQPNYSISKGSNDPLKLSLKFIFPFIDMWLDHILILLNNIHRLLILKSDILCIHAIFSK